MAEYARLRLSAWSDPRFKRGLNALQKLLLLYYRSSPHSNLIGLYSCPPEYAAAETGLSVADVREWSTGALSPWITYDSDTEEVFVHDAGLDQIGELRERDKRITGIVRVLESIHSERLQRVFVSLYPDWPIPLEGALKGLARASEAFPSLPSPPLISTTQQEKGLVDGQATRAHAGEAPSVENSRVDVDNSGVPNLSPAHGDGDVELREASGRGDRDGQERPAALESCGAGVRHQAASPHLSPGSPSGADRQSIPAARGDGSATPGRRSDDVQRGRVGLSDEDAALADLAREHHERQERIHAAKTNGELGRPAVQPVIRPVPVPGADGEPMPERLTPDQVAALWASRQRFPPDGQSLQRQAGAAAWLAKQSPHLVVRAMYGIGRVFPHSKGEAWTCDDVRRKWDKAIQEAEKHPELVTARTAQAITERMNGGG